MFTRNKRIYSALTAAVLAVLSPTLTHADINYTGDITPSDPATWTLSTGGIIGESAAASLTVDNGSTFLSNNVHIGWHPGSTGIVNITGPGSTWISTTAPYDGYIMVGSDGTGILNITNGGTVSAAYFGIGGFASGTGLVNVDGPGSSLSTTNDMVIGRDSSGTLNVTHGGTVNSAYAYISDNFTPTGIVNVDGPGSQWIISNDLNINGQLNITNHASVSVTGTTANTNNLLGTINFGPQGGTLTTTSLYIASTQLSGTGSINTSGIVTDQPLLFDTTHGLNQSLLMNNVTVNLTQTNQGILGTGYLTNGTLTIADGLNVPSSSGYLGYLYGSGTATITGPGSTWSIAGNLNIGWGSNGQLVLTHGGSAIVGGTTWLPNLDNSNGNPLTGSIFFGPGGGILTTGSLIASPTQLSGTGIINTSGILSDLNLVFDATHGSSQTVAINNITLNLAQDPNQILGVGYRGTGTLTIADGQIIGSNLGFLGYSDGTSGTATITGLGSTWSNKGAMFIGNYGNGTLNITHGGLVRNATAYLGYLFNAVGTVNVDGSGSKWFSDNIMVGTLNQGSLNITNGGLVECNQQFAISGNHSTVSVDGNGSLLLIDSHTTFPENGLFSMSGNNTLNITNGGVVTGHFSARMSGIPTTTSTANVDGPGSQWVIDQDFTIGDWNGTGLLNITHGGYVSNANATLGSNSEATGVVNVDGPNSHWLTTGTLTIGGSGTGTLNLTNGGTVSSNIAILGNDIGSVGSVIVDGTGSILSTNKPVGTQTHLGEINPGSLYIGYLGTGSLTITHGGKVTTNTDACIGYGANSQGTVTVDGAESSWVSNESLTMGGDGAGTLIISNGGSVSGTVIMLGANSHLSVEGTGSNIHAWNMHIGLAGNADLTISHGGSVVASSIFLMPQGSVHFGPGGGIVNTTNYYFVDPAQMTGTGTINTSGIVGNLDLVFDASHGPAQTFFLNDVAVNLNLDGPGDLGIGNGTLRVMDGVSINSSTGIVDDHGVATVTGRNSTWFAANTFINGSGTLNVINGGALNSSYLYLNYLTQTAESCTLNVDGSGSHVTTQNNLYVATGVMNSRAKLNITHGGTVDVQGYTNIGYTQNSIGFIKVDGVGSSLSSTYLFVGGSGTGNLSILNGGMVQSNQAYLGDITGSIGHVLVDGKTSNWDNTDDLHVGSNGSGSLIITNGGSVTTKNLIVGNSSSLIFLDVGVGSALTIDHGSGTFTNLGTLRLAASPRATPGTYTPINAGNWTGTGNVQALGGSWDTSAHTFLITPAVQGHTGNPLTIDLQTTQRLLITDPTSHEQLMANFQATPSSSLLTLLTTVLSSETLSLLQTTAGTNQSILSGWTFAATGYTTGDPVFLSLDVGPGVNLNSLALWHFDGTTWSAYAASDLSYDGTYANFTVTGFNGYAVSTAISTPEPTSLSLLTLAGLSLLARRRNSTSGSN